MHLLLRLLRLIVLRKCHGSVHIVGVGVMGSLMAQLLVSDD